MATEPQTRPLVIFLHIPKTAGTAFRHMLYESVVCRDLDQHPMLIQSKREWKGDINAVADKVDVLCGHFPFGIHERIQGRACEYVTILRNPIDRVLSYFDYVRTTKEHHYYKHAQHGIGQFLIDGNDNRELDNLQVRLLSNNLKGDVTEEDLHSAIHNIQQWFAVAGVQERFAKFLEIITEKYGWSCVNQQLNRSKSKSQVHITTRWKIADMNALDIRLYEHVRSQCIGDS